MTIYQTAPTTDGTVSGSSATWATARSTATFANDGFTIFEVGLKLSGPYVCYEALFEFDISAIATGSTTNNLSTAVSTAQITQADMEVMEISAIGTLTTADWVAGASLTNDYGSVGDDFDSTGRKNTGDNFADIGRASDYSVLLFAANQRLNVAPTDGNEKANIYFVEESGTTNDPYLEMDDTPPPSGYSYGFIM